MTGALTGLRVVEIAGDIAGPYCTKLLVDLGADVIKVEPPSGDPLRRWGPFPAGVENPDRSGLFEYLNAGKRGATIDLDNEVSAVRPHLERAHLLVDGLPPSRYGRNSSVGNSTPMPAGVPGLAARYAIRPGLVLGTKKPDCDIAPLAGDGG